MRPVLLAAAILILPGLAFAQSTVPPDAKNMPASNGSATAGPAGTNSSSKSKGSSSDKDMKTRKPASTPR